MHKVAQVTIYLWIIKICTTTLVETADDLLSMSINVGYDLSFIILIGLFLSQLVMHLLSSFLHLFGGLITLITQLNRVILFWIVLTLTRPFGKFFRGLLTKAFNGGGLEFAAVESFS